jgi:hypothetical protein
MTFNGNGNRRAGDAAGHSAGSRGNNNGAEITRRPPKVQVVSAVHGPGSRLAFEPHRESDPALADLQDIQLGFELMVEDAKLFFRRQFEMLLVDCKVSIWLSTWLAIRPTARHGRMK